VMLPSLLKHGWSRDALAQTLPRSGPQSLKSAATALNV